MAQSEYSRTPLLSRHLFGLLITLISLHEYALAQTTKDTTDNQKLVRTEQSLSAEARAKIAAVRSVDSVWCGIQDKHGVLWFGTNEGVYCYDGKSFTQITTSDGLSHNQVSAIMEDREGFLWFGTADGLCRYDRRVFTHVPIPWGDISGPWLDKVYPIVNPNQVLCMLQGKDGSIWLGTNGSGAYRYDGKTFTSFLSSKGRKQVDGLYHNVISSMVEDAAGNIWFTSMTHGGVTRYDGETFTHLMPKDGLSDDMVLSSFRDRLGNLWFGSNGNRSGGLDRFAGGSFLNFNEKHGLIRGHIRCIHEDGKGNLWLGCDLAGIFLYDGERFAPFTAESGQRFERTMFFAGDAAGNVWFGGAQGRLFMYDGKDVKDFSKKGTK